MAHPVLLFSAAGRPARDGRALAGAGRCVRGLGWEPRAVGPDQMAGGPIVCPRETFPPLLRDSSSDNAAGYDVVEYDHIYLPFLAPISLPGPLFVARWHAARTTS